MTPGVVVLAAVAATWAGHTIEYLRVSGAAGLGSSAARSVHAYMGPTGLVLAAFATVGVYAGLRLLHRLEGQLAGLEDGSLPAAKAPFGSASGYRVPLPSLVAMLWILQLVLYVVQENTELRAVGVHQPILGVLTGAHQWAAAVHLGVAAVVALMLWLLHRPITRVAEAIRQVAAWLSSQCREGGAVAAAGRVARAWTPAERWGSQRWSRPPPAIQPA